MLIVLSVYLRRTLFYSEEDSGTDYRVNSLSLASVNNRVLVVDKCESVVVAYRCFCNRFISVALIIRGKIRLQNYDEVAHWALIVVPDMIIQNGFPVHLV
jgi:hypothetical protein